MVENNDRSSSRVGLCDSAKAGLARVCAGYGGPGCKVASWRAVSQ